jgi:DNA-binding FadR family transcriptional regulator
MTSGKDRSARRPRGHVVSVVNTLGSRITSGFYAVGETLPVEKDLAEELDVGRNALREAVKVLSGKGLLQTAPRAGTRVCPRDQWNLLDPDVLNWHADPERASAPFLLDLLEVRRIIEPKAAELAAVRASKTDIAEILSAYERMERQPPYSEEKLHADIEFHSAILKASQNPVLNHFKHAISTYLRAHFRVGSRLEEAEDRDDLERHRRIAWEIAAGKAESAFALTVEMLELNQSHVQAEGADTGDGAR